MKKKEHKKSRNRKWTSARTLVQELLNDSEVRIAYEEERIRTHIALLVKRARKKCGLTQLELAEKVGTSQSMIARLESGEDTRIPSLPVLARIASAFNGTLELRFEFEVGHRTSQS